MYKLLIPFTIQILILINFPFCKKEKQCDIITEIINHKQIQHFLHPEVKGRDTLYIEKSQLCDSYNQKVNNIVVITIDNTEIARKSNYMQILKIDKKDGKLNAVSLGYPIEGASFVVHFDNHQKIINIKAYEN
ncbi:hypothetical protein ABS768_14425 [Flavobacterium sp. ST-75]|uniref:Uncharacterized protein n=1 Tax=Flavobacterium rhizophilum TaxID=3163296 RepID=A0ABW8YET5_9FLAO